jgi:hypothetical protein
MRHNEIDPTKVDAAVEAPNKAHAGLKSKGTKPDVETEETFDNAQNNASALTKNDRAVVG